MKNLKLSIFVFCFANLVFLNSCVDEETNYATVNFEDVALTDSILKDVDFTSGVIEFNNDYNSNYFSWSGFACSSKKDINTSGYTNDLSAYVPINNINNKFGVLYSNGAYFSFGNSQTYRIKEMAICTNTYAHLSMKNGDAYAKQFTANDWFRVRIYGHDVNGMKMDSIDYYLADFRNGKTFIANNWATVNLEKLGEVNKVSFAFASSDNGAYGMNTPAYACIDNIKYILPQKE